MDSRGGSYGLLPYDGPKSRRTETGKVEKRSAKYFKRVDFLTTLQERTTLPVYPFSGPYTISLNTLHSPTAALPAFGELGFSTETRSS